MGLAAAMLLPLAACGGGSTSTTTKAADNGETAATTAGDSATAGTETAGNTTAANVDTSKFVTITMLVLGNKPSNGRMEAALAAENEIYKEKINAELQLQYIEWTDWQTNYQLTLASGDGSVDLIGTATDWLYAWQMVQKGAFLPLDATMLQTYAPTTYEEVGEDWDLCTKDGSIWFIPEDQYTQWTNHGIYYRGDWATEAGLDTITNFDQLGQYFQYIVDNKEGVIPWDVSGANNTGGLLGGYLGSNLEITTILGVDPAIFTYNNDDPYTVTSPYMDGDTLVEAAKLFKQWSEAGYWREDVLNYTGDSRDQMYAGKSGADQHHTQTYVTTTRPIMDEKQPGSDLQFFYWGEENNNVTRDLKTHGAMAVSASSPNPERALMLYDILRNDETAYRLHNYGIEGTDYIVTDDNKLDHPEGYDASTDALDTNFWYGRMDAYELDQASWYEGRSELFEELDSKAHDYALTKFAFDPTNVQTEIAALTEVYNQYIPSLAYGKVDDPEASVTEFRNALKSAGYETVLAEVQKQLDELKASEG